MSELWDVYTDTLQKVGKLHRRGDTLAAGEYHLAVQVWITDGKGRYLLARRAASREVDPLKWECVGGSAIAGENSLAAALREAREEVGVTLDGAMGRKLFTKICHDVNTVMDVWLFSYGGEVNPENATTPEEVDGVTWATKDEITALYRQGEMVRSLIYFFYDIDPV